MRGHRAVRFRPGFSGSDAGRLDLEPRVLLSAAAIQTAHLAPLPAETGPHVSILAKKPASRTITTPDAITYIPAGLKAGAKYPLLVVFNAQANANASLKQWKAEADRDKWIVVASRTFSNSLIGGDSISYAFGTPYAKVIADGYNDPNTIATIKGQIEAAIAGLPVDRSRIILAGFSGGAFFAHDLNATYPGFAAAVIDNSNGEPLIGLDPATVTGAPDASSFAGSRREAVFLVGTSDQTFGPQIQQTIPTYQRWGWQTLSLTYPGGHKLAPTSLYRQAIKWLLSRPSWK